MFRKSRRGKWCPCLLLRADHCGMFSLQQATETRNFFFFVSFSKDVFLVLVKSETNRVTGKPNTGGTRVETERKGSLGEQTEGNSFGSWWRFLEHSQISAAQTPIVGFCSRSELAMARPPQRSRFEVARVWSCSAFLLVQRWQVHIAFHSDREHPQFL